MDGSPEQYGNVAAAGDWAVAVSFQVCQRSVA